MRFRPLVYRRPSRLLHDLRKRRAVCRAQHSMGWIKTTSNAGSIDWSQYDAIVVGSDIVWDFAKPGLGSDPVFAGVLPPAFKGRLVAYAPSIGAMSPTEKLPEEMIEGLRRFSWIGVRDRRTADFVHAHVGVLPPIVADPTWLPFTHRPSYRAKWKTDLSDTLLVYSFPLNPKSPIESQYLSSLVGYARDRDMKVLACGYFQPGIVGRLQGLTPWEWIGAFQRAGCVVTGTFHGALFSIRYGKRFVVLPHPQVTAKLSDALATVEAEWRMLSGNVDFDTVLDCDPDPATQIRAEKFGERSLEALRQALS